MSSALNLFNPSRPKKGAALLPGNRFFVRRLSIEGDNAEAEVNLALETLSPFPLEQMLVGYILSEDGKQALAYAAHRRRFTPEESFAWPDDCQVMPEFVALCGIKPDKNGVIVHRGEERLTALAWKEGDVLPSAIIVAELADASEDGIAQEAAQRAGLESGYSTKIITGLLSGEVRDGNLALKVEGMEGEIIIPQRQLDATDIRDTDFLALRRKKERTNLLLWNVVRVGVAVIALSFIFEVAGLAINWRTRDLAAANTQRHPLVTEIEAAQGIVGKIVELGVKRPLPLEMLSIANDHRPATIDFQRMNCKSNTVIEIEGRTSNAGDITVFEHSMSALPEVASVVNRDIRARETSTTFTTTITFKAEALRKLAQAQPKQ
jgi:hypothetical protein